MRFSTKHIVWMTVMGVATVVLCFINGRKLHYAITLLGWVVVIAAIRNDGKSPEE